MSHQLILWAMIAVPWLTLFFLKKEDIKRFMPVALFTIVTSSIITEVTIVLHRAEILETAYPLILPAYIYGFFPVITIFLMKFFYKKFWLYVVVDTAMNVVFTVLFLGTFLVNLGIIKIIGKLWEPLLFSFLQGLLLYAYQIWQEGVFNHPYKENKNRA